MTLMMLDISQTKFDGLPPEYQAHASRLVTPLTSYALAEINRKPWGVDNGASIFIGGDDRWKTSGAAKAVIKCAQLFGKWVHVGRVNGPERLDWCFEMGVDSIDGSGLCRFDHMLDTAMAKAGATKL